MCTSKPRNRAHRAISSCLLPQGPTTGRCSCGNGERSLRVPKLTSYLQITDFSGRTESWHPTRSLVAARRRRILGGLRWCAGAKGVVGTLRSSQGRLLVERSRRAHCPKHDHVRAREHPSRSASSPRDRTRPSGGEARGARGRRWRRLITTMNLCPFGVRRVRVHVSGSDGSIRGLTRRGIELRL